MRGLQPTVRDTNPRSSNEFELVYEPKVKIATAGAVVGGGCG